MRVFSAIVQPLVTPVLRGWEHAFDGGRIACELVRDHHARFSTLTVKSIGSLIVVVLAGSAVWIGGPVGFIGLVAPHLTRYVVGLDYRWLLPCAALVGGLAFTLADLGARMIAPPYETPVGLLTAAFGVPFFVYLARRDARGM